MVCKYLAMASNISLQLWTLQSRNIVSSQRQWDKWGVERSINHAACQHEPAVNAAGMPAQSTTVRDYDFNVMPGLTRLKQYTPVRTHWCAGRHESFNFTTNFKKF